MALAIHLAGLTTSNLSSAAVTAFIGGPGGSRSALKILRLQQQFHRTALRLYSTTGNETTNQQTATTSTPSPSTATTSPPLKPSIKTRIMATRLPRTNKLDYDTKMQWNEKTTTTTTTQTKGKDESKDQLTVQRQSSTLNGSSEKPDEKKRKPKDFQGYVFRRYFDYVKNYDKVLEKNFPRAINVYRVFLEGVREFFGDMKRYLQIVRTVNNSPLGMRALIRRDLELYQRMPNDMYKVAPALIGTSLPMVGYAFFPLIFMFPRQFLTAHFWTLQQRAEFQEYYFKQRLLYNKPVFRGLQSKLKSMDKHPQYENLKNILGQLGSGFHPTVEEILAVKDIFAEGPLSLQKLPRKQINNLIKMNGVNVILFKRFRLREHAFLIHLMDLAIMKEGHTHNMDNESLRVSCYLRGLNPVNLSNEVMIEWLRNWTKISTSIQEEHISLFLHLPILMGYNHPNNWQLIYGKKKEWKTGSGELKKN